MRKQPCPLARKYRAVKRLCHPLLMKRQSMRHLIIERRVNPNRVAECEVSSDSLAGRPIPSLIQVFHRAACIGAQVCHAVDAGYVNGTAASGDSTRNVKLSCKYSSTDVLV
jgi:hypothetical protein